LLRETSGSLPWEGELAEGIGWAGPEGEGNDHVKAEKLESLLDRCCVWDGITENIPLRPQDSWICRLGRCR
jgi:hypothetical protein